MINPAIKRTYISLCTDGRVVNVCNLQGDKGKYIWHLIHYSDSLILVNCIKLYPDRLEFI